MKGALTLLFTKHEMADKIKTVPDYTHLSECVGRFVNKQKFLPNYDFKKGEYNADELDLYAYVTGGDIVSNLSLEVENVDLTCRSSTLIKSNLIKSACDLIENIDFEHCVS